MRVPFSSQSVLSPQTVLDGYRFDSLNFSVKDIPVDRAYVTLSVVVSSNLTIRLVFS